MARPVKPKAVAGPVSRVRNPVEMEEEKRFTGLRRRLTDEGYPENFGFESTLLVDRLLDDLLSLRQTHTTLSSKFDELAANEQRLQRSVHPVQKELGRMVRENNQLHLELIEASEQAEASQRRIAMETKKLHSKIADQGFLISQQSQHIRDLETQLEAQKDRISDLLDNNFTCTVGPYGDLKPKGQQIMLTHAATPKISPPELDMSAQVIFNMEDQTTKQIDALNAELRSLREVNAEAAAQVKYLEVAVAKREGEIVRMGKLLSSNVNSDMEDLEKAREEQDNFIKRLNDQLDIVSAQLADAEEQREELEALRRELPEAKAHIRALQGDLSESRALNELLQAQQKVGGGGASNIVRGSKEGLEATKRSEVDAVRAAAETAVELEDALEKLSNAEDDLYRLQGRLDEREEENRELNGEVRELKKRLASAEVDRKDEIARIGGEMNRLLEELDRLSHARDDSDLLREELERYKSEIKRLSEERATPWGKVGGDAREGEGYARGLLADEEALTAELHRLMDECELKDAAIEEERSAKEYMAEVIKGFEAQMQQVQGTIKSLTMGWDDKECEYLAAIEAAKQGREAAAPGAGQGRGEGALEEALEQAQEAEARAKDAQERLALVEQGSRMTTSQLQHKLSEAKERAEDLEKRAVRAEARCVERERAITELQSLLATMDGSRDEIEAQLRSFIANDESGKRRAALLEEEIGRLTAELRRKDQDRERALASVGAVDRERDDIMAQLDSKAEAVRVLELRLREEMQMREQRESAAMVAQQQADMLREATGGYDVQLSSMQRQLQAEGERMGRLQQLCEAREEEIGALSSDLSAMTRENQVVNGELADIVGQRDALKSDLDATLERLMVAEQLLMGKESERDEVLMSYRSLHEERGRVEANYERALAEVHELKNSVYTREEELQRSAETVRLLEQENHRVSLDLQGLQRHTQALADRIVQLEGHVRSAVAEGASYRQEQQATAGALSVLERSKQEVVRESALLRDEIVALRGKAAVMASEREVLEGRHEAERMRAKDLEDVLQALRAKEHSTSLAEKGLSSETASLREQLQRALSDRERLSEELRMASSRRDEAQYELQRVKRHVSSDGAERDSLSTELAGLRSKVTELQNICDSRAASLDLKDREAGTLRARMAKVQAEAEASDRKLMELESKVRRNEESMLALQAAGRTQLHTVAAHETESTALRMRVRDAEQGLDKARADLRLEREALMTAQGRMASLSQEVTDCKADRERLRGQLEQSQAQVSLARQDAAETSDLLEKLDADYRMMQSKYLALLEGQRGSTRESQNMESPS